jgi:hypothetical protein
MHYAVWVLDFGSRWICWVVNFSSAFYWSAGLLYVRHRDLCNVARSRFDILRFYCIIHPGNPAQYRIKMCVVHPYDFIHWKCTNENKGMWRVGAHDERACTVTWLYVWIPIRENHSLEWHYFKGRGRNLIRRIERKLRNNLFACTRFELGTSRMWVRRLAVLGYRFGPLGSDASSFWNHLALQKYR